MFVNIGSSIRGQETAKLSHTLRFFPFSSQAGADGGVPLNDHVSAKKGKRHRRRGRGRLVRNFLEKNEVNRAHDMGRVVAPTMRGGPGFQKGQSDARCAHARARTRGATLSRGPRPGATTSQRTRQPKIDGRSPSVPRLAARAAKPTAPQRGCIHRSPAWLGASFVRAGVV